ncbi:MAG: LPXTG cell wall anchor domain-containing protein, partial [Oscillospiraceae bacterium]|nr:LPXTG cell wall anchor domain-containing protein [Oscillospiraceae bacterium]
VVKFEKLRTGEYFYREFDAPHGYILDETKYPFTIKENGEIVKCEITNTKLPQTPPHTGDISNNIPAFVMLGLSAAIAAILCILKLKKGKKNEK